MPVFTVLLLVISIVLGEVGARVLDDPFPRWFSPLFGVAFAIWTYVFFFDGQYRVEDRMRRLLMLLALSAVGFPLIMLAFPVPGGIGYKVVLALILSVPSVLELLLGKPAFHRTSAAPLSG